MPFGVLIQPGRQAGHAIGPSGDRHRHPVVLITRCYCVHPLSFLEPGGRLFDLSDIEAGVKAERVVNFFKGLFLQTINFFKRLLSASINFSKNIEVEKKMPA